MQVITRHFVVVAVVFVVVIVLEFLESSVRYMLECGGARNGLVLEECMNEKAATISKRNHCFYP